VIEYRYAEGRERIRASLSTVQLGGEADMVPAIHMVMGLDEATLIGHALKLLDAKIEFDLEQWEDESEDDRKDFLSMLSLKFTTQGMRESISELLSEEAKNDRDND